MWFSFQIYAFILISSVFLNYINAELTPPYFNLATGRKIYATATCGVGVDEPELYCKLVGANTEHDSNYFSVIQGQICDYCDPSRPDKHHPPENAIDGTEAWWQSPPLSRGMKYNEVDLVIDFGQEFHVAYIFIRMGNSPRPGLWTLEKSTDYGKTWTPWQHFSDTASDCEIYFGKESLKPIEKDNDVICTTEYSKIVPLENGEIPVMLLNNRPSANNYFNSTELQEWTRATNVRIRLLRTKNLLGHLMSVARQDPTVTRRYFYSIKDISIGGRCMCNGHADTCDVLDPKSPVRILACRCQHKTCGIQCNECCPGFEQKKWHQNTNARPFQCEPCNCFGHSNRCAYNATVDELGLSLDIHGNYEGGGVCSDCQHNTDGINCNKCKPGYYRPYGKYWNETDVCQECQCNYSYSTGNCEEETGRCECRPEFQKPDCQSCAYGYFGFPYCRECECNLNGTNHYQCEATSGRCPCKANFAEPFCKQCAPGYYNYPVCEPCNCGYKGSVGGNCNSVTGQCSCLLGYGGKTCEECKDGYYDYENGCKLCSCEVEGTVASICDKTSGKCLCKEGYGGEFCNICLPEYYGFPNCIPCNCSTTGSISKTCDVTGKCQCLQNFGSRDCSSCVAGYYKYPDCVACECSLFGSEGISCNSEGQCTCKRNFDGIKCDMCKEGFYNLPLCEECNCDPAGVIQKFAGCQSMPKGELCQCKERVTGRICDQCKPLYWNLSISNPDGCERCDCHLDGTIGSLETCDTKTGQCICKPSVQDRQCKECKDGTYGLEGQSLFGCKDCNCDIGGSRSLICDKVKGQCPCHQRISGRTCSNPMSTHYFPTLHQFQFEYEDGYTPSGAHVRYQYNESNFQNFSEKGYAVFSDIQNEVLNEVNIFKSSVYRMVIRYHNPTGEDVIAHILITSDNPNEVDQTAKVLFKPTYSPEFVTVAGAKGDIPSPIVLDPGRYTFSIKSDKNILLDYFVLLPAAYYEASILTRKIDTPCLLDDLDLCRHYRYPSVERYNSSKQPLISSGILPISPIEFYDDIEHKRIISYQENFGIPILSDSTPSLKYPLIVNETGYYVIVVDYISHRENPNLYTINVRIDDKPLADDNDSEKGILLLYPCLYSMICRQPVVDDLAREKAFFINANSQFPIEIYDTDEDGEMIPIVSVTAIPIKEWSVDFIKPSSVCVVQGGKCIPSVYRIVPDSKKIEVEQGNEDRISTIKPDYATDDVKLIHLSKANGTIKIQSKAVQSGRYVIIIQYYQPNHPNFQIPYHLATGKQNYYGRFDVAHCPSSVGCRGILHPESGFMWFDIDDEFNITLTNNRPEGVWLDYLLLVPFDQFNENLLEEETFDRTKEFIRQCGHDHFYISLNASDFCKKAVFSLTADYNEGALQCNCNHAGSKSFECDPFGGQCPCKDNVIGRRCQACRTGYWGFPDCKLCDCPLTAHCEKDTGKCICPPHVTGDKCDQCEPYTYGFHQIIGCEECNCHPEGVLNGNLQCDLINGTCQCRTNIKGRTCDQCTDGFYRYPDCERCHCDKAGTTYEICDKYDGSCLCKSNVIGATCERCVDGTFFMDESNPEGCTKCFCFGKASRCSSAFLRVYNISMLSNVSINDINIDVNGANINTWSVPRDQILVNETVLQVDYRLHEKDNEEEEESVAYFGVLDTFASQNNHLTAYGGYLVYHLYYTTGPFGKVIYYPDVILHGSDKIILHYSYEQPSASHLFIKNLQLIESNFKTIDGKPVSRADFMMILRDLHMIYIRAYYETHVVVSQISDVYLSVGAEDEGNYHDYKELPVERCDCPEGYTGLSCESCAPGFYRIPDGPYGGYCIPCQCHGHAETCDCNTGICKDCMHHTTGDYCEKCIEGYHGNATYGSPHDCLICSCPKPFDSNNFATSCEISESGYQIHCECKPGYIGARCESCAPGFYGQPEVEGDYCKPCECSGNIDPGQEGSCDTITGECLLCLNNTYGKACNLCAPGFYGDAIKLKNCQACDCDEFGVAYCDQMTGICNCLPNVIGERCDSCKPNYYGHASGLGCKPCNCGEASYGTQCNDVSGNCDCKPGVAGRQCDHCAVDYWNYTIDGCTPCNCNKGFSRGFGCNSTNGQCECLPGVIGEKCDRCPHRWVLEKERGCFQCDACHHALLNVTDELYEKIEPVFNEFQSVARAHFTRLRLENFNLTARELAPRIASLDTTKIDLEPMRLNIENLELDVKQHSKSSSHANDGSIDNSEKANKLLENSIKILDLSNDVSATAQNTIKDLENLANSFDTSLTPTTENAKIEAEAILEAINAVSIDLMPVTKQLQYSSNITQDVEYFIVPAQAQSTQLENLIKNISNFQNKLNDLKNWSLIALENSYNVDYNNKINRKSFEAAKFDTVANQTMEINQNNQETIQLVTNGTIICNLIDDKLIVLNGIHDELKDNNQIADESLPIADRKNQDLKKRIDEIAWPHAKKLEATANNFANQYLNIKENSETAISAVNAYSDIYNAVEQARNLTTAAKQTARNATDLADGLKDKADRSDKTSIDVLNRANSALRTVQLQLQPLLNNSINSLQKIIQLNSQTNEKLNDLNRQIEGLVNQGKSDKSSWQNTEELASYAQDDADNTISVLKPIINRIDLDLEKAKNISKGVESIDKDFQHIIHQNKLFQSNFPEMKRLASELSDYQQRTTAIGNDLKSQIEELKRKIARAREQANSIKVGVTFDEKTTLELKPPESLPLLESKSKVSFFFNTTNPNGFLMYLGNHNKSNISSYPIRKGGDFMALEVENGYPVLTIDLGNGPERIINDKYVADGKWYQAIVDRDANNVNFVIREQFGDTIREYPTHAIIPGQVDTFNVDKNSRLFVGGYPPDFVPPEDITRSSFEGQIEGLKIGDEEVGLWNFIDASNNKNGALGRNTFLSEESSSTGYRFNGNGFVIISSAPYNLHKRSSISFWFKASRQSKDGLMFYAGKYRHFISIEMVNGAVKFQYNKGQHLVKMQTEIQQMFNDDVWHQVEAVRDGNKGKLRVDDYNIYSEETPMEGGLEISEYLYFGGVPDGRTNHTEIVDKNFDGCIKDVVIDTINVDLKKHEEAYGVRSGCPDKFSNILAYPPGQHGFLKMSNIQAYGGMEIQLNFRTRQKYGILFYATNYDQSSVIGLLINDGVLALHSTNGHVISSLTNLNDGQLHSVRVSQDNNILQLVVDNDVQYIRKPFEPLANGDIYFGGLPKDFRPLKGILSTLAYFVGCISDVKLNGNLVNFANASERQSGQLDNCSTNMFNYDPSAFPIYYPGVEDIPIPIPPTDEQPIFHEFTTAPPRIPLPHENEIETEPPPPTLSRKPVGTTTTQRPTRVKPSRPRPKNKKCALSAEPDYDNDFTTNGFRFGVKYGSRLDVMTNTKMGKKHHDIMFSFKTDYPDGLIIYASTSDHNNFFTLFMYGGQLYYIVKCKNESEYAMEIVTTAMYNDGMWHNVHISRGDTDARLFIDQSEYSKDGKCSNLTNLASPLYFGGVAYGTQDRNIYQNVQNNIPYDNVVNTFNGCIQNIQVGGKYVTSYSQHNLIACSDDVEHGVFFGAKEDSYVKLYNNFSVGTDLTITFEMRPRTENGLIMSVHGTKSNYLMIQLYKDELYFNVMTSGQELEVKFTLNQNESFCDGQWRKVQAIKSLYVITLAVNDMSATPSIGNVAKTSTNTYRPLFLGGHQNIKNKNRVYGIKERTPYHGCIRNIKIGDNMQVITPKMAHGDVWTGLCPLY